MRFLRITDAYAAYLEHFYGQKPGLEKKSYLEQKKAIDEDAFSWIGSWPLALRKAGYEAEEIILNATPLQSAWAKENQVQRKYQNLLIDVFLSQVRKFKPDVIWFDSLNEDALTSLREEFKAALVLGWAGSAFPKTQMWKKLDLVLSCAPESVASFKAKGIKAAHLDHAFDPAILKVLKPAGETIGVSFIGQILGGDGYHAQRRQLLEGVVEKGIPLTIFSIQDQRNFFKQRLKSLLKKPLSRLLNEVDNLGLLPSTLSHSPFFRKAKQWEFLPKTEKLPKLTNFIKPGVYGVKMLQTLKDSKITLNVHADSSPTHASNMRLFEATGVGTCLVTDWKDNLPQLFKPDSEVVTYRSTAECIEKILWLLESPQDREMISAAGQKRALKDHTFDQRALELSDIIRNTLKS